MWAAVGGTVLLIVAQIVAVKILSEGISWLAEDDVRKDIGRRAQNVLTRGKSNII